MKEMNHKKLIGISLILTLFASCGKENKSSGTNSAPASSPSPVIAPVQNNINSTGQQALSNAQAWYNSTVENSVPTQFPAYTEYRQVSTYSEPNCKSTSLLGGFINISGCFNSPTQSSRQVSSIKTPVRDGSAKSGNSKLAAAFNTPAGYTLLGAQQTPVQNGSLFQIDYGNSSNGHVLRYTIDTSLNSAFNPVSIYDTSARVMENLINANNLRN
jgi:hypothetical protein